MAVISKAAMRPSAFFALVAPLLFLGHWQSATAKHIGSDVIEAVEAQAEEESSCALQTRVKKEVIEAEEAGEPSDSLAGTALEEDIWEALEGWLGENLTDNLTVDMKFFKDIQRPVMAGALRVRSQLVARLQSAIEEAHHNSTGTHGAPAELHEAVLLVDDALKMLKEANDPSETNLGFPLTVSEALAFYTGVTKIFGLPWSRDTAMGEYFAEFAQILLKEGLTSKKAHDYYDGVITYAEHFNSPIDLGWVNNFIAIGVTYTKGKGLHAYRKVPWSFWGGYSGGIGGYNPNFSVRNMPKEGLNGGPLVIGLISDWAGGTPEAAAVLLELKKQNPDIVIHLGDTYYSGTEKEQKEFLLKPILRTFGAGKGKPMVLLVPGNHDYYSDGGQPFFDMIDKLKQQDASYFCLRGEHFQILALDTGIIDNAQGAFKGPIGPSVMTFLPSDQATWAQEQLRIGETKGLKTIMLSHHQFFSRNCALGAANAKLAELSFLPDQLKGTFPKLTEFKTKSEDLPGHLPSDQMGTVNTRLQATFLPESLKQVAAWFWGHDHQFGIFEPYAGLERGRLIGNGCIQTPKDFPVQEANEELVAEPWGGFPELKEGGQVSKGDRFWGLSFATVTIDGPKATARYFQLLDSTGEDGLPVWGEATQFYEEEF